MNNMVFEENSTMECKSLKFAIGAKSNLKELAETCVCFANAQGGTIVIGIENAASAPPEDQKITMEDVNKVVARLRDLTDGVGIANPEIYEHENGGSYFIIRILPSMRVIATTKTGKIFIRFTDKCYPVGSDELTRLAAEKSAFQWELVTQNKLTLYDLDTAEIKDFVEGIRNSSIASEFIRKKEDEDILKHYQLINEDRSVTNLGILWLGFPQQRARISYPITVQYIVYNENEEKIRKVSWHFHRHNPKSLLLDIEKEAVELTYSTELPNGLFRKQVRNYPKEVVRELLINAIAHKKYTLSGDIFIEVYHNRMSITSPGGLPLGISKDNILHERHRRNPHLIQTLHDLSLMEGEGSGYDLVYEKLVRDAKPLPEIDSSLNTMTVTIYDGVGDPEVLSILDYVDRHFRLTQKELICLGIVAKEKKILPTQLSQKLQLTQEDRLRGWIGSLLEQNILIARGVKKGTEYLLNPELFSQANLDIKPSLKTIAPLKLQALIEEDLKYNASSKIKDIHNRLNELSEREIQKTVYKMVADGVIEPEGGKRNRTYSLAKKK